MLLAAGSRSIAVAFRWSWAFWLFTLLGALFADNFSAKQTAGGYLQIAIVFAVLALIAVAFGRRSGERQAVRRDPAKLALADLHCQTCGGAVYRTEGTNPENSLRHVWLSDWSSSSHKVVPAPGPSLFPSGSSEPA